MEYYFGVISCEIKEMHTQFSLHFRLHNAVFLLSKLPR